MIFWTLALYAVPVLTKPRKEKFENLRKPFIYEYDKYLDLKDCIKTLDPVFPLPRSPKYDDLTWAECKEKCEVVHGMKFFLLECSKNAVESNRVSTCYCYSWVPRELLRIRPENCFGQPESGLYDTDNSDECGDVYSDDYDGWGDEWGHALGGWGRGALYLTAEGLNL